MADDLTPDQRHAVRQAETPWTILRHDWWPVLKQTWTDSGTDNIGLIAAGTAFWGFASIAPLLGAMVLGYGLFATSETVSHNIQGLFGVLPHDAATLIADQLTNVVGTSADKKGWGFVVALALAVYGGTQGASAVVTALNVAYEEKETRSLVKLYGLAFAITGAAVLLAIAAALTTTVTAFLGSLLPFTSDAAQTGIRLLSYLILAVMATTAAALLFRFGPDRRAGQMGVADAGVVRCHPPVAARDVGVWFLRVAFRQLWRDLRVAGRGDRVAAVAVAVGLHLPAGCRA